MYELVLYYELPLVFLGSISFNIQNNSHFNSHRHSKKELTFEL